MFFTSPSTHPQRLALPESIIRVSFQKEPITNLDYRVGEGLGRLLRKIVSRIDDAVFMQPDKHAGVLCGPTGLERVAPSIVTVGTFTVGLCARWSSSGCNAGSPASRPKTQR